MTGLDARLRRGPAVPAPPSQLAERAAASGVLDVMFATVDSPIGPLLVVATERGLARVGFPQESRDDVLGAIATRISPRVVEAPARLDGIRRELDEYFSGARHRFDVALDWSAVGQFGRQVLDACAAIPYGATDTYAGLARAIGAPRAARAVGNALGANPIPIVVPCHRVLRTGGGLGGYGGGLPIKEHLLRLEGALAL
ncbi:MAG: methylated-DNA--[protein]-cysteine S-methyltransferase [Acidobacteria bacterium]|nr:methylated-DNA--[protein]-cysteine S-methyltransferase [Acidobacteriota bacterium]